MERWCTIKVSDICVRKGKFKQVQKHQSSTVVYVIRCFKVIDDAIQQAYLQRNTAIYFVVLSKTTTTRIESFLRVLRHRKECAMRHHNPLQG
jgi:hypothetical protein